jgi:hypothetical protein
MAALAFSLILTVFTTSADHGARADIWVLDTGMTAEDCTAELVLHHGDEQAAGILSCTLETDI